MQPDAKRGDLEQLLVLTHSLQFTYNQLLAYVQEAHYQLGEGNYEAADTEMVRALEVIRGLVK